MKIGCIVMAAGASKRFGGNKLTMPFNSRPIFHYALDALPTELLSQIAVVSGKAEILDEAKRRGFIPVLNDKPELGPPRTIRLGMEAISNADAIMFMVADQPLLTRKSVAGQIGFFSENSSSIVAMGVGNRRGNPVIFPRAYFDELMSLHGERGGGAVMAMHEDDVLLYQIKDESELMDIDTALDYALLQEGRNEV